MSVLTWKTPKKRTPARERLEEIGDIVRRMRAGDICLEFSEKAVKEFKGLSRLDRISFYPLGRSLRSFHRDLKREIERGLFHTDYHDVVRRLPEIQRICTNALLVARRCA